ncbi:helix-turn-helix domain-containing protein [Adlercreutzia sp. ZJ473]|uniref:helix-turn-helix domain-containing protein n=1 Tax=Adlercreutzia sp. ZJ473 TaxID=2722822 RepID=UPI001556DDD4|nr:helix-turn-helix domain-containing protein [Adlercreutzia sp. ZJ473]
MGHHTHLTLSKREGIMILHREGESISGIARKIGRAKPTLSRELERSSCERF